jgi:GNAT superfamily N-acetyltransferase
VPKTSFIIEAWQPPDREGAISTVREVFEEYGFTWDEKDYHADLYDVPTHYLAGGHQFFVARSEEMVVGTVAVAYFSRLNGESGKLISDEGCVRIGGTDCSLERLYVRPLARRRGVGRALISAAISAARSKGCSTMEIWSDKHFSDAHRLYRDFGADVVGDRVADDPDQSSEWGLMLTL